MGRQFRVMTGMDYAGKRREAGDVVDDIPVKSVRWLLEQGHIEPAEAETDGGDS